MEEALRALLLGSAAVIQLVPAARIVWGRRVGLPAIMLLNLTTKPDVSLVGLNGVAGSTVQLDCWASTFAQARDMRLAVMTALCGSHTGAVRTVTPIDLRQITSEPGDGAPGSGEPPDFFRAPLDLRVWHAL